MLKICYNSYHILDICIDQKTVGFRMHIFHGNLKTVKAASLGDLGLTHKPLREVLKHDSVADKKIIK